MSTQQYSARSLLFGGRPFDRREADAAGLSRHRLAQLVQIGLVVRPFYGVYVDASARMDECSRAAAVARVLPAGAVVCRRTAAWLYGVDARGPMDRLETVPLECAVPSGKAPLRHPNLMSYATPLSDRDTTRLDGVPVTTPSRTAVDLARWLPPHMGLAVVDRMLRMGLVEEGELAAHVSRFEGGRWIGRARRTIALADARSESYGESWLRLRVADAGLPAPTPQVVVRDLSGNFIARVDLGDRERRLAIEYDGQEHHSSEADRAHDLRRRQALADAGWRVLVATKSEVLGSSMRLEEALGWAYSMPVLLRRRLW